MSFIQLKQVTKTYDGLKQIIQPLNIDIKEGEFIVIVGPSGCGKSTFLRMIAGLESTSSGEVWIANKNVTYSEPKDRQIAMVFQNYALYPHMTVYDNMAYGLKIRGESKISIDKKVNEVAQILSLEQLLKRKPKELSGGQRQRVAMGRAIVRNPAVFLFDEPLSNLDAKLRVQMRLELKALQARLGVTSLYVTHDQVEAMTLADRVMIMNQGVVEQMGSPEDLYHNPKTTFVASFIGSPAMNLLNAKLSVDRSELKIVDERNDNSSVKINVAHLGITRTSAVNACQSLILGIRPEHIEMQDSLLEREERLCFSCEVKFIEHLGADNLIYTDFAGQTLLIRAPHDQQPKKGNIITVSVHKNKCYFFDGISHHRLSTQYIQ